MNNEETSDKPEGNKPKTDAPQKPVDKKKRFSFVVFVIGLMTLATGATFLLINIFKAPDVRDAEYLVQIGAWQLEDEPTVVWHFTEIGKGTLTTNFHINDYDFIWAIDENRIKIETDWLYTMDDEYVYELNQNDNKLVLMGDDETFTFIPAPILTEESEEKAN
ncbi:hypothetical protein IKF88_01160 [Candidatus Saccharibacteria bacterium]|nr:hypothetical protein [Candidatus Saccharibacteria bacterium]